MASALGIAASTSSGLKAFQQGSGGMVKRLHGGLGAANGMLAWQLASRGFSGPQAAIGGHFGLMAVFGGPESRPAALTDGLGEDWAIRRNWIKVYPCCALIHTTIQAVEQIRREQGLHAEEVARVRIGTSERCLIQNGDRDPREPMAAQYSIPFNAALALAGDARDPNAFLPPRLEDPAVRRMLERVELHLDAEVDAAYPDRFGTHVAITTRDGRTVERRVWDAHGTPADPCTADEIREKFAKLAGSAISHQAAARIVAAVEDVDAAAGPSTLAAAIRSAFD